MSEPITTDELLDAGEAWTGLSRAQLVRMVGKSAAIRYVARHSEHGPRFVLKGGSLLTHVYGSPRQSIADADYVHVEPDTVKTDEIEAAFTGTEGGFTMRGSFRLEAPHAFKGTTTFAIEGIEMHSRGRDAGEIDVTISVRAGEWLDPHDPVVYTDRLLAGDCAFDVQGLSVAELSAEKVLGWCSKDLAKHLVDIAYVQREYAESFDYERSASLIRQKFELEKGSRRYQELNIRTVSDLAGRFTSKARLVNVLHARWERTVRDELLFLPQEGRREANQTLLGAVNIERLALEFWTTLEPLLGGSRRQR